MSTPDASIAAPGTPTPQPVLTPLTESAIFLVVTINEGAETAVRDVLADLAGLQRTVGFRDLDGGLVVVAGIGSTAWDRLYSGPRPHGLHPFPELAGDKHAAPSTPGDVLFHIRAHRLDLCFELASLLMSHLSGAVVVVDEVHGFKYFDERDLLGFVDGTENPTGSAAAAAVTVGDEDPPFSGSSYVIIQRYVHDVDTWNAISTEEQERVIGRTKLANVEFPDEIKPINSHVAVNTLISPDGDQLQILRDNMPFGNVGTGEFGTFYIAYSGDPAVTEQMLYRMFIGEPRGNYDRILDFSTALTGTTFFVPTTELSRGSPTCGAHCRRPFDRQRAERSQRTRRVTLDR